MCVCVRVTKKLTCCSSEQKMCSGMRSWDWRRRNTIYGFPGKKWKQRLLRKVMGEKLALIPTFMKMCSTNDWDADIGKNLQSARPYCIIGEQQNTSQPNARNRPDLSLHRNHWFQGRLLHASSAQASQEGRINMGPRSTWSC